MSLARLTQPWHYFGHRSLPNVAAALQGQPVSREPRSIADVLNDLESLRGFNKTNTREQLRKAWADVAGEFASQSRALQIRAGVLHVAVSNPAVLDELSNFRKNELLSTLREKWPELRLRDLKFKLSRPQRDVMPDDDLGF